MQNSNPSSNHQKTPKPQDPPHANTPDPTFHTKVTICTKIQTGQDRCASSQRNIGLSFYELLGWPMGASQGEGMRGGASPYTRLISTRLATQPPHLHPPAPSTRNCLCVVVCVLFCTMPEAITEL